MTVVSFVVALALIVAGVALVSIPAGLIVAGVLGATLTVWYERGEGDK